MASRRREFLFGLAASALSSGAPRHSGGGTTDLFEAKQGGYALYRIPGIVVTRRGAVLTYAEARRNTGSDWDDIDLVLRRGGDGGRTFDPAWTFPRIADVQRNPVAIERNQGKPEWRTYNNPVAIASRTGEVHFLFCVEYMRVYYSHSTDDGRTFSQAVEITSALEPLRTKYPWRVVATGPGHGLELNSGRLLVPVWIALGTEGNGHGPAVNTTIYSDDRGRSWHAGEIAISGRTEFPSANETAIVEHADGRVTMNVRTASAHNRRTILSSPDGISRWSEPRFEETLTDPNCAAGLIAAPRARRGKAAPLWVFSNPDSVSRADGRRIAAKDRRNLTLRVSRDEGATWKTDRVLEPGPSAYSDLAFGRDGSLLCFYETRNPAAVSVLRLARLRLETNTK